MIVPVSKLKSHPAEDEVLTYLIHHNKQRIKTCREQLNEIKVLMDQYKIGQGKRTDISTSENPHRSSRTREMIDRYNEDHSNHLL